MDYPQISKENPLILASSSPRRIQLLQQIRLPFRPLPSGVDEDGHSGEAHLQTRFLAEKKATVVSIFMRERWVLGADTVVVLEGMAIGKPANREEAALLLDLLGGKQHTVVTGICLVNPSGKVCHSEAVATLVRMKTLTALEIDAYVRTGEPLGKAGAYAIQGVGAFLVEGITGSYTNVVGLPLCALVKALVAAGAIKGFPLAQ